MIFRSQPESFHYVFIGRPIENGWQLFPAIVPRPPRLPLPKGQQWLRIERLAEVRRRNKQNTPPYYPK